MGWLSRIFGTRSTPAPTKEEGGRRTSSASSSDSDRRILASLTWYPVSSSNVEAIAYHDGRPTGGEQILAVKFLAKGRWPSSVYFYYDCPISVFQDMRAASSKGQFHWRTIRDVFSYKRVA